MAKTLSIEEAKRFYDGFGAKQDSQGFYEDAAVDDLLAHAHFDEARAVIELGCGTGRLAERLLRTQLHRDATYRGIDLSDTMIGLASERLAPWRERASLIRSDGSPRIDAGDGAFDRFLSTYVLDLLAPETIEQTLAEAHRVLAPGGLLCLASLTFGATPLSKVVTWVWQRIHALRPALVGGCRPIDLRAFLPANRWHIEHHDVVAAYGISSEVVVAARVA